MYTAFYQLTEKPFNVTPDPRFLYLSPSHREALSAMIYGIRERKGFIVLTAEAGTGKTTLVNALLADLDKSVKSAFIYYTHTTFEQLLRNILLDLDIKVRAEEKFDILRALNRYLSKVASKGGNVVVVIDEAHNLSLQLLEEIRMLSNIETAKTKLLQIVLVGQPELDEKLDSRELRQLKQRIAVKTSVSPLTISDFREYAEHRLKVAGGSISRLFTADALALIFEASSGLPRMVNILCDNAFLIGYARERKPIDHAIIEETIHDLHGDRLQGTTRTFLLCKDQGTTNVPRPERPAQQPASDDRDSPFGPAPRNGNTTWATETIPGKPQAGRTVDVQFFLSLENELKKMMGPVAPIVIDDKMVEFHESQHLFPEDLVKSFLLSIAEEIPDTAKRMSFLERMISLLRTSG